MAQIPDKIWDGLLSIAWDDEFDIAPRAASIAFIQRYGWDADPLDMPREVMIVFIRNYPAVEMD